MNHTEAHEMFGLLMDLDEHGVVGLIRYKNAIIYSGTPLTGRLFDRLKNTAPVLKPLLFDATNCFPEGTVPCRIN